MIKVFIIPHPKEFFIPYSCPRAEAITIQGLQKISDVQLVDNPGTADIFILNYPPHLNSQTKWDTTYVEKFFGEQLVVLDYVDEPDKTLVPIEKCFLYFKRSILEPTLTNNYTYAKDKLIKLAEEKKVWPLSYGILDEFLRSHKAFSDRSVDIGCYLRPSCPNRQKVLNFIRHVVLNDLTDCLCSVGEVSSGSRSEGSNVFVDPIYFNKLADTKINVVCNPSQWIGDSRFWESLSSGCLTVVDEDLYNVPGIQNLFGKSVMTYNINNLPKLRRDLKDIFSDLDYAEELAKQSQEVALTYFTSEAIMKYVVNTIKRKGATPE